MYAISTKLNFRLVSAFLLTVGGILLFGCAYEPEAEYFKEVKMVEPTVSIDLKNFADKDTITLIEPTTFSFNVGVSRPASLDVVDVIFDEKTMVSSTSATGTFVLSQAFIATGFHTLTLQFTAKSNSGSLADKLDGEHLQVWRSWIVKVLKYDNSPPSTPKINITEKDGRLRVDWSAYVQKSFISYKLKIESTRREISFTDSLKTFWIDSTFLTGSEGYTITVTNRYGSASAFAGITESQELQVTYHPSDSTTLLKWKPSRFYKAFSKVVITENETIRETITNRRDSTFTLKLKEILWGRGESVTLQVYPASASREVVEKREYLPRPFVPQFGARRFLYYSNPLHQIIGHEPSTAYVYYYDDQLHATDSQRVATTVSLPFTGQYIFYLNYYNSVARWDLASKQTTYSTDNANYYIDQATLNGSSNGLASYFSLNTTELWDVRLNHSIRNTNGSDFLLKTDINYEAKTAAQKPTSKVLSDDGKFYYDPSIRSVFKLEGGIQNLGYLPLIGAFHSFRQDNSDEIFVSTYPSTLNVLSSTDYSILRTFTMPTGFRISNYDPVSHNFLYVKDDATLVYMINVDSGTIITYPAYSSDWKLMDGYLYNSYGEYKKVL